MRHPLNCHIIHDIDLFGKEPELYYKGKNKKSSLIGRVFTILYILIYIAFFVYKLIRMLQKVDVTFYQTTAYTGEIPQIHLTNEIFYGGFALANARTLQPFIDESIYYIDLQFRTGERVNNMWNWKIERLELEVCNLSKFNPKYYDLFKDKPMNNMYCPKNIDLILQGHITYDTYSYFYVGFYPCVNSTYRHNCKPPEIIDQYLKNTYVSFKMQDIELTPQIYDTPIQLRCKEVNSPAAKSLFQNINAYFQVVELETDNDIVGFEGLSNIKKEKYLKYNGPIVLSKLYDDSQYHDGQAICDVTVQLTEQVLTIKRTYTKLIEVLGDVGGLMEVIYMSFKIISTLITDLLYEKSMVNNLFNFDLGKKIVLIKDFRNMTKNYSNKKEDLNEQLKANDEVNLYNTFKTSPKVSKKMTICTNDDLNIQTKNKVYNNEEVIKSNIRLNDDIIKVKKRKKKKKIKKSLMANIINEPNKDLKDTKNQQITDKKELYIFNSKYDNNDNFINSNEEKKLEHKLTEKEVEKDMKIMNTETKEINNEKENVPHIIKSIKINKCILCLCFLCFKKRKNVQNILLDEGMAIITHYLDIINIFKKLFKDSKIQEASQKEKNNIIEMSEECLYKLSKVD